MNLFEKILSPQAKKSFSWVWQQLQNKFQPVINTWAQVWTAVKEQFQPVVSQIKDTTTQMVAPIAQSIEKGRQRGQVINQINTVFQDAGITLDDIKALAEEEWIDPNEVITKFQRNGIKVQGMEEMQAQQQQAEQAQIQQQNNPELWFMEGLWQWIIWATQFWQQAPSAVGNLLNFTQKYVTTPLLAWWAEMVWAEDLATRIRAGGEKFGRLAKQSGEQTSREAMQAFWPLTENQLKARQTGANLALTAPIPLGKVPKALQWAKLLPTIGRWAYYGAVGTPTYTAVSEWRLPTGGEMVTWTVWGAVAWPLLEKAVIPAVSGIASKAGKYGTALVKWGTEWLKKSVSRDLSWIPKAIQSKAEAISTRANRFNALDEEKFTKQIWETPWQFAVSRGMTDVGDDAIVKANQNYQKSIQEADKSIWAIEGNFSTKWQKDDILWELVWANKAKMELQPRNPDANKARQLFNKYESWEGLTMAEINEAKRIYQRNHTYTYEQLASNEARNSKYLQDWVREWQFKTAKENGLTNIADINKTTKAWKMYADSLAKKINRSQANNEFWITDWIALSGGTPENIALFLWKKALSSKYVKSGIIKTLGKQTKPSIIEWTNVWVQQANFQKNVNRGISNNRGDIGGKSMVKPAWLLPAPSGKATWAKNIRVNQLKEKSPTEVVRKEWIKDPRISSRNDFLELESLQKEIDNATSYEKAKLRENFASKVKWIKAKMLDAGYRRYMMQEESRLAREYLRTESRYWDDLVRAFKKLQALGEKLNNWPKDLIESRKWKTYQDFTDAAQSYINKISWDYYSNLTPDDIFEEMSRAWPLWTSRKSPQVKPVEKTVKANGEWVKVYKWVKWEWNGKKFPLDYFTTDKKSASQYWNEVIETTIYPKKIADFTNPSNKRELRKILRDNLDPRIADEFIDRALDGKDSFSGYPLYEMVENPKVTQALKDAWYDSAKYLDFWNKNSKFARHETIAMLDVKPKPLSPQKTVKPKK